MSRNPILNDRAFQPQGGTALRERPTPAEEWEAAQRMGQGATAGQPATWSRTAPQGPIVIEGRTMSLGGVASATPRIFPFVLLRGRRAWTRVTGRSEPLVPDPAEPVGPGTLQRPGQPVGAL